MLYIVGSIFEIKNSLLFHFGDYFLVPKTPGFSDWQNVCQELVMLNYIKWHSIYEQNMPGIGFIDKSICQDQVMLISSVSIVIMNKTYARNRFCWQKVCQK